ncbi:hypothetical protein LXL04_002967 [Taraxacum kok-saghyz]
MEEGFEPIAHPYTRFPIMLLGLEFAGRTHWLKHPLHAKILAKRRIAPITSSSKSLPTLIRHSPPISDSQVIQTPLVLLLDDDHPDRLIVLGHENYTLQLRGTNLRLILHMYDMHPNNFSEEFMDLYKHTSIVKMDIPLSEFFSHNTTPSGNHSWIWTPDHSDVFTVSSLRKIIDYKCLPNSDMVWNWSNLIPGKVNIFTWRLLQDRIPTLANLVKIGISHDQLCPLCNQDLESSDHLFLHCQTTKEVWDLVRTWWKDLPAAPSSIPGIVSGNAAQIAIGQVFLWSIWRYRNHILHQNKKKSHKTVAFEIQLVSHIWFSARNKANSPKLEWLDWNQ